MQRPNQFGRSIEKKILKRSFKVLRKGKPLCIEKRQALIVKVRKPIGKCKDMAVNTDINFQS